MSTDNSNPTGTENQPSYTPGPWQARGFGDICHVIKAPQCLADRYAPIVICECCQEAEGDHTSPNALLIAAAPDLLEAAKEALMLSHYGSLMEIYNGEGYLDAKQNVERIEAKIRAAITKAEAMQS